MNADEFNTKYQNYLEDGHYGLSIHIPAVIDYLDKVFIDLIKIPGFKYAQIKVKFNMARFYTNLHEILPELGYVINNKIEAGIDELVKIEDEVEKRLKQIGLSRK